MQRRIVVPVVGFALVVWLGGCTSDSGDGGIIVLKNVRADSSCNVNASETETGLSHGSLELLSPGGYLFIAQMRSRITALSGQEDQRTIIISGANVDIAFPNSSLFSEAELAELRAANLLRFKTLFSAALRPNGGLTDAGFELIPGELVERVAAKLGTSPARIQVVATFTIEGDMSGAEVTSQPFSFPVTLGRGAVFNNAGACPLANDFGMPRTGYACNPAQDGIVDCCSIGDGETLRCPAVVSNM
jgi:hypothetical protein